jgi:hypothetical protein
MDGATSVRSHSWLPWNSYIYIRWHTCSGQNQNAKVLKIVANSQRSVVLSSKAATRSSLISDRNPNHKVEGVFRAYEISLYCLLGRNGVLRVSACRISIVVYIPKVSSQKTLLLKNGEIYNAWVPTCWLSFLTLGCLHCNLNISTQERFWELKFLAFSYLTWGYIPAKFHRNPWHRLRTCSAD